MLVVTPALTPALPARSWLSILMSALRRDEGDGAAAPRTLDYAPPAPGRPRLSMTLGVLGGLLGGLAATASAITWIEVLSAVRTGGLVVVGLFEAEVDGRDILAHAAAGGTPGGHAFAGSGLFVLLAAAGLVCGIIARRLGRRRLGAAVLALNALAAAAAVLVAILW